MKKREGNVAVLVQANDDGLADTVTQYLRILTAPCDLCLKMAVVEAIGRMHGRPITLSNLNIEQGNK